MLTGTNKETHNATETNRRKRRMKKDMNYMENKN